MKSLRVASVLFVGLEWAAGADDPPKTGVIEAIVVDATSGEAVASATAILTTMDTSPVVVAGLSDARGRVRFPNLPPGRYQILFVQGGQRTLRTNIPVSPRVTTPVRGELDLAPETIIVHERAPLTIAEPIRSSMKRELPYSDAAIDSDAWEVSWLLLDIDESGKVAGFRFLHRPGHGLDAIAAREVWALRFKPSVDAEGRPAASQLLWKMEWPAYRWRQEVGVIRAPSRAGPSAGGGSRAVAARGRGFLVPLKESQFPPCRGTAPLDLDSVHPVYRDCSPPDLDVAVTAEFVARPAQP